MGVYIRNFLRSPKLAARLRRRRRAPRAKTRCSRARCARARASAAAAPASHAPAGTRAVCVTPSRCCCESWDGRRARARVRAPCLRPAIRVGGVGGRGGERRKVVAEVRGVVDALELWDERRRALALRGRSRRDQRMLAEILRRGYPPRLPARAYPNRCRRRSSRRGAARKTRRRAASPAVGGASAVCTRTPRPRGGPPPPASARRRPARVRARARRPPRPSPL